MRKRNFKDDDEGQAFSLDVMMALIIITVIMGVSANAMDMASYKMQDYSSRFSLERATVDAADVLVKSPGSPQEWEAYNISYISSVTPGLAKKDPATGVIIPNTLTFRKISRLQNKYDELIYGKLLPNGAKSSMIIYPIDSTLKPIVIKDDNSSSGASEIAIANRTVLCDYMYVDVKIGLNAHRNPAWPMEPGYEWENCTHKEPAVPNSWVHNQPVIGGSPAQPGWACRHFYINKTDLDAADFYVITDPRDYGDESARWMIDKPSNMTQYEEKFDKTTPVLINNKILEALGPDYEATLWFHVKTAGDPKRLFDAYVVSVPKGTPSSQVQLNYLNPQPCYFVLKTWY